MVRFVIVFACVLVALLRPAVAGELRLTHSEMAGLARAVFGAAKLTLENRPTSGATSSFEVLGVTRPIPLPGLEVRKSASGAPVYYYFADLRTSSIRAVPVPGGVRVTIAFEDDGPELVPASATDPALDLAKPELSFIARLVEARGSLTVKVSGVTFKGRPSLLCATDAGGGFLQTLFGGVQYTACEVKRSLAGLTQQLKGFDRLVAGRVEAMLNAREIQDGLAEAIGAYLKIGDVARLRITDVSSLDSSTRIRFCIETQSGDLNCNQQVASQ